MGQLLVWAKSPALVPVSPMLVMVRVPAPLSVSVTVWAALLVPTFCVLKLRLGGLRLTAGAGVMPVPLKATLCGLPVALSASVRLALRAAATVGVKVTLTVQEAPAASVLGLVGQLLVWAKSPAFVPPM